MHLLLDFVLQLAATFQSLHHAELKLRLQRRIQLSEEREIVMSRAAKLTLTGTSLFAVGTIIFVHHAQQAEKAVRLPFLITS